MITKENYLKAVETIKSYKEQLIIELDLCNGVLSKDLDSLTKDKMQFVCQLNLSNRLKYRLSEFLKGDDIDFRYARLSDLEGYDLRRFCYIRNFGRKCLIELLGIFHLYDIKYTDKYFFEDKTHW